MEIHELRKKAYSLEPLVRVGKEGLKDTVMDEIRKLLEKREMVKIKFLKSFLEANDRKEAVAGIIRQTDAIIIREIGHNVTIFRKKTKRL